MRFCLCSFSKFLQADCYDEYFDGLDISSEAISGLQKCLTCQTQDYTHYSIIFNAFVFSQLFNEFNARSIFDEWNVFKGMSKNPLFIAIILVTIGLQVGTPPGARFTCDTYL